MHTIMLATALYGLAAPAAGTASEAELDKALRGRVAGAPVRCLPLRETSSTVIIDRTAILYTIGDVVYVNRLERSADMLRDDDIPVLRSFDARICRPETVNLVDRASGVVRGFVRLGDFVPYRRVPAR